MFKAQYLLILRSRGHALCASIDSAANCIRRKLSILTLRTKASARFVMEERDNGGFICVNLHYLLCMLRNQTSNDAENGENNIVRNLPTLCCILFDVS